MVPPSSVDDGENGENDGIALGSRDGGGGMNRRSGPGKLTKLSGDFDCMLRGLPVFSTTDGLLSGDIEYTGELQFSEFKLLLLLNSLAFTASPPLYASGDNLVR